MQKFLIFSDLHASIRHGLHGMNFVKEVEETLTWIAAQAKANSVDAVLFLGDIFHVQESVDTPSLHTVVQGFKRILETAPVYVVEGNHDVYRKDGNWTSVEALRDLHSGKHQLTTISKATSFSVGGLRIHAVPYTEKGYTPDPDAHFMIGHLEVNGAAYRPGGLIEEHGVNPEFGEFTPKPLTPSSELIHYIGGHYHHPQIINHTLIVGSCCFHSFADQIVDKPRGAVLLSLQNPGTPSKSDFLWIENPYSHPTHTIHAKSYAEAQSELARLQGLCRVPAERWQVRTYLPTEEAETAQKAQETAPIKTFTVIPDDPPRVIARTKITSRTSAEDALVEYMKQVPPAKNIESISLIGKSILEKLQKEVVEGI